MFKVLKTFWAWYTDPKLQGSGVRLKDWLTPEEIKEFESEPNNSYSLEKWLKVAYDRRDAAKFERGLLTFIIGAIVLAPFFILSISCH